MSVIYNNKKIHIKQDDYFAKFMDWDDTSPCYVLYYIEPTGPFEANEMSDSIYSKGDFIPYHEHHRGLEVFLVDNGSVECHIRGKRAVAEKGDMVVITPYVPHGFTFLEDGVIWRELFQQIQMNEGILKLNRVREYHPETAVDPAFMESVMRRDGTVFFAWEPRLRDVEKAEIPQIRPYDYSIDRFDLEGISFLQKVERLETNGHKEVWQIRADKGIELSWNEWNPHSNLFVVCSGSVLAEIDGMDAFTAGERDIINIPSYLAGRLSAKEDCVLLDYNCVGFLYRALDELAALKEKDTAAYADSAVRDDILGRADYFIRWK